MNKNIHHAHRHNSLRSWPIPVTGYKTVLSAFRRMSMTISTL
jgi:hypothetical protein